MTLKLREADILKACLKLMRVHPYVVFVFRANSGAQLIDGKRWVKFGFVGMSDLLAMARSGRFLAVECKAKGKRASEDQQEFLDSVNSGGGLGLCVDNVGDLIRRLDSEWTTYLKGK